MANVSAVQSTTSGQPRLSSRFGAAEATAFALLVIHIVLFSYCAIRKSICVDEGAHLAAGVAYLRFGEFSVYDLSPPLMRMWDAIPSLLAHSRIPDPKPLRVDPAGSRHWTYFEEFQAQNLQNLHRFVLMGRFMQLPISLALAIGILLVARQMYGPWPAVIAMGAYCLEPTVLAQASTVGTDLGLAAAMFAAVVAWSSFLKSSRKSSLLIAALSVGIAHSIKFNALLVWPVLLVMMVLARRFREGLLGICVIAVSCYVTVNLCYGFQLWGRPIGRFEFQSHLMQTVQSDLPRTFPAPFPQYLLEGFDAQKWEADGAYVSALFGRARFGGDWRYYPWLLVCKTPLAELVLGLACLVSLFRKRPGQRELAFLLLCLAIAFGMIAAAKINVGLRYLLPAYPALAVLCGRIGRRWIWLTLLMCIEIAVAAPRLHSYTNLAAWSLPVPDQDQGQSLVELHEWMQQQHVEQITLVSLGWVDPAVYGIPVRPVSEPPTKYVAIGKAFLDGLPRPSRHQFLLVRPWRQLLMQKPIADFGGMVVYRAESLGDDPWIRVVSSWEDALHDPEIIPIENLDERRQMVR